MSDDTINLRDQVAVVRRRWRTVAICTLLGLVAALALSLLQSPLYRSETRLEIRPVDASGTATNGLVMQPSEIATQVQVLLSTPVAERVISSLRLDTTPAELLKTVSVSQEADTRVINVSALRSSAAQAQEVAAAFADEYLSFRTEQAVEQSRAALADLADQAQQTRDQLASVRQKIARASGTELSQLQSEEQVLLVELTQILGDQAVASVSSPGALGDGGQVLVPASLPGGAAEPQPLKSGFLGAFLGLILGIVLAFVRDHFDDALRDESRLREAVAPRPVLGSIPHWTHAKSGRLATVIDPASPVSEAYRSLSTSIRFLLAVPGDAASRADGLASQRNRLNKAPKSPSGRGGKVLLVTSPMEAEGKTSVSSNLAVVAARFGLKVILVDADLRSPQLASVFGLGRPPGLSDLLASDDSHGDYLIDVENLKLLPGGSLAPNPAELLASPRMRGLLAALASAADLVIVDTTPVTRVADALELVGACDLVLLAARHGQTRLRALDDAITKIQQVGGILSGAVYVDVPGNTGIEPYGVNYAGETPADKAALDVPKAARAATGVKDGQGVSDEPKGAVPNDPDDKQPISKAAQ